jgi:putative zinc finger protein
VNLAARLRRRRTEVSDPHQLARRRIVERLDAPLAPAESTWLDEHLAGCPACAGEAAAYQADLDALRGLRANPPEPPRDLWARTAAGIEHESGRRRRGRHLPVGALSGLAVIVVVIGATLLSGGVTAPRLAPVATSATVGADTAGGNPAPSGPRVDATPFSVGAGDVAWVDQGPDGGINYSSTVVDSVCPSADTSGCPAVREDQQGVLALKGTPRRIIGSPTRRQAVAIADAGAAGDELVIVALPEAAATPAPTQASSSPPAPSIGASPSPGATASASAAPLGSGSASPEPGSTAEPSVQVDVSPSVAIPSATPAPSVAVQLAIASGIIVVGESAAFSPDGSWFAFTARPVDGSFGADVYVWHVGHDRAHRLTRDGLSYFASWADGEVVASRPSDPTARQPEATSVSIDPTTGQERPAGRTWRPIVDPTGRLAIGWTGTLAMNADTMDWQPGSGRLALGSWSAAGWSERSGSSRDTLVADAAPADFDVRWDESGEWVAVWVADGRDADVGRLSLLHVDTKQGRVERVSGAPTDVPALPGFSIGDGRLAWATPRGQGGEGSRIQIAAWSTGGVGTVESGPGGDPVVIR